MEDYKEKYELGSVVTATRTFNRETITGEFGGFHLLDKSNPKSIVGGVHTSNGSYDVEPNSIESAISEDERIRKGLINFLKSPFVNENITDEKVTAWLAWIEKQDPKKHEEELKNAYKCADEVQYRRGYEDAKREFEKQDEQNPINNQFTPEQASVLNKHIDKSLEQTCVWSEEDEKEYKWICVRLQEHPMSLEYTERVRKAMSWLNFLKERVQPQNLTVTDEELIKARNEAYNDALDKLEYHSDSPTFNDGWSAAIWYLKKKNAQPQSIWKPSDEQMDNLSRAFNGATYQVSLSRELYQDLKKLKEE